MSGNGNVDYKWYSDALPETMTPFGAAVNVTGSLTPLFAFANYSRYRNLLFTFVNTDATNSVTITVETSQDGTHPDINVYTYVLPAGKQCSLEVSPPKLRRYFRASGQTAGPTVATTYQIEGGRR